jgi:hypothetical protein
MISVGGLKMKAFRLQRLRFVVGILSTTLLLLPVKAFADLIEYALVLVLIITAATIGRQVNVPPGWTVVINQLQTAVEGARAANLIGDGKLEASRLSKALGAGQALMAMTSPCDQCGDLRNVIQQIIGKVALLKTAVVGASGTCHPNGVLQPNEQCDPLAVPTGCAVSIELTFCSDECTCVPVPVP